MLLVVNAGSSSLKLAVFDAGLARTAEARLERIGAGGPASHAEALREGVVRLGLDLSQLSGAAHRVVHGGAGAAGACRITPQTLAMIRAAVPLAPLHNPANLTAIRALAALMPDLAQYVSFDTAFHATNPAVATTYALPLADREAGLRRYGFHGLSYAALVHRLGQAVAPALAQGRILALHLGNGASLCAVHQGRSVATTMGYSPLDGLTMGTRAGSIDGNAVLALAARHGIDGAARILNHQSGLLGLGGAADMRSLHADPGPEAAFAREHFRYWAVRHAGSLIAAMGGLDAIAFTGGIGENDAKVRARIVGGLSFLGARIDARANMANEFNIQETYSNVAIWIVPAEEEQQIAREAMAIMAGESA